MRSAPAKRARDTWIAVTPAVFVFLWSTGFIGAKFGLPYAEPMTFLALRFAIVGAALLLITLVWQAPWPGSWRETGHIAVAGLLLHGVYLGGVFASIDRGVEAGVSAIIVGIQPLLTAAAAGWVLGERVTRRQWFGLVLGVLGVLLVVWRKLVLGLGTPVGVGFSVVALFGITAGALYQKRFCAAMPLRSGNVIQFAASAAMTGLLALAFETREIAWTGPFVAALTWLVVIMSLGAISLLHMLIRRGAAARVASLFYLVPPTTALMAWLLFDERFGPLALVGMAMIALGVAGVALVLVRR
jgi:drug/metabolite transporter (DMT)-like permease